MIVNNIAVSSLGNDWIRDINLLDAFHLHSDARTTWSFAIANR